MRLARETTDMCFYLHRHVRIVDYSLQLWEISSDYSREKSVSMTITFTNSKPGQAGFLMSLVYSPSISGQ